MMSEPPRNSPFTYSCGIVGQSEYSLIPCLISGSWRTSTVSYFAPRRSRIAIARLEKPHWGKSAVPFMNSTISSFLTRSAMRAVGSLTGCLRVRHRGFELQCVKLTSDAPPKRGIDGLMLLDPAQSGEAAADDARRIMVAVAGEVADRHLGVRNSGLD